MASLTPGFLENELGTRLSIAGEWEFSVAGGPTQLAPVPAAWEVYQRDKAVDGPVVYRCAFQVPANLAEGGQLLLEFGAVSFWALVRVNNIQATVHQGMWSAFQVDIRRWVHAGENILEVEVWKPGHRFPLRETVAGFLPDVATAFGGIWQHVHLLALQAGLADLKVLAKPNSQMEVSGVMMGLDTTRAAEIAVEVDPGTEASLVARMPVDIATGRFAATLEVRDRTRWSPGAPNLHAVAVSAWQNEKCLAQATRLVGLRDIVARDGGTWIDNQPLHLRGVLDWGWNPEQIRPARSREAVVSQIEQSRTLGFNLIKLCLFVPDETTFQVADELGQYLWLEMPLWQPHLTPEARELARQEFQAVFRRLHHHASIAVISLGCELNAEADASFLAELHALAREWFPNALVCDNSGSAEAYGGVTTTLQDFYDYHFYTDPHLFPALLDHFERDYRPRKPWIFGEFCDADTGRDFSRLNPEPWWITDPVALDRDDFQYTREYKDRHAAFGIEDGGAALAQSGRQQATAVRKYILEQTRMRQATGGYVVAGWSDTPITTSGMVDDQGQIKFPADEWQRFNGDGVLAIDRDRRRRWVAGGDRPAFQDPYTWWAGDKVELHLILSNGFGAISGGRLYWRVDDPAGNELASGSVAANAAVGGEVTEIAVLRWRMPADPGPVPLELTLQAGLSMSRAGGGRYGASNRWKLWAVPRPNLGEAVGVIGREAFMARYDLGRLSPQSQFVEPKAAPETAPIVAHELSAMLLTTVSSGRDAVLWQTQPDKRYTRRLPFWRESIHAFIPHPLWSLVPQPGYADMRFFSVATDMALDMTALKSLLGPTAQCRPVWRRYNARSLTWADYIIEVQYGSGRLFVSSLRFEGGLGCQPEGFDASPWGAWILASLLHSPR